MCNSAEILKIIIEHRFQVGETAQQVNYPSVFLNLHI